jgi:hypothetical protein
LKPLRSAPRSCFYPGRLGAGHRRSGFCEGGAGSSIHGVQAFGQPTKVEVVS